MTSSRNKLLAASLFSVILAFASSPMLLACSSDGAAGPAGPPGAAGPEGATRATGAPVIVGGGGGGKVVLREVDVVVDVNPKTDVLARSLFSASSLEQIVIQRVAGDGTSVDLATFAKVSVTRMEAVASDTSTEHYAFSTSALTVNQDAAHVTFDPMNGVTCAEPCPCQANGAVGLLGPYTQASGSAAVPTGNTRVDSLDVAAHNTPIGSGSPKLSVDSITVEAALETSGVCAFYYAVRGLHVNDLHFGVAAPTVAKSAPVEATTWDACGAFVSGVGIASSPTGSREQLTTVPAGVVRTDRTIDPMTGLVVAGQDAVIGWSVATNAAITACP